MDRIEQLMKAAKPRPTAPNGVAGGDAAHGLGPIGDMEVIHLAARAPERGTPRGRTAVRTAAATVLAAAAVAGAVYLGGTMAQRPMPGPAGVPSEPSGSAAAPSQSATPPASEQAHATAPPSTAQPGNPAAGGLSTGGVPCTPANIDQLRNDQQRAILPIPAAEQRYYTVLGCAGGWLSYTISDEGARALQLDGGNAWFRIAKLQNDRFLWDVRQPWATVLNWDFQALNNQGLTPQEAMDRDFAAKGLPVELRPQLVGEGPAAR
ncbi:hypothetical protein [Arthrobacter sp. FW306-06-A]|uniref:hypothetical protein n=1 Tax=Arthrobacter sp. FW306-06-A TaxID=2879621 RepID=UPI001F2D42AB|nr:hypothetical protein [Arthrobacter sp. FW306-06-A]UKA72705.1 hypothetical protein LFT49_08300 [Arthrobacter sp. FW306-06-A]